MYNLLRELLSDKKGGTIFTCFGIWHILFVVAFLALSVVIYMIIKNKDKQIRKKVVDTIMNLAFGLYIADFFLMPFAYGEIDVEKLPFHVCTAMCVMCFFSRHNKALHKFKLQFACFGFVSNLVYLIYPAGVMWHQVHPLSYRVIQTLVFHGVMVVYGVLVLCFESEEFSFKKLYRDVIVISSMTVWAIIGNALYNSQNRVYNWFFVVQDPFNIFGRDIAWLVMPFLNIAVFLGAEVIVYLLFMRKRKA